MIKKKRVGGNQNQSKHSSFRGHSGLWGRGGGHGGERGGKGEGKEGYQRMNCKREMKAHGESYGGDPNAPSLFFSFVYQRANPSPNNDFPCPVTGMINSETIVPVRNKMINTSVRGFHFISLLFFPFDRVGIHFILCCWLSSRLRFFNY